MINHVKANVTVVRFQIDAEIVLHLSSCTFISRLRVFALPP